MWGEGDFVSCVSPQGAADSGILLLFVQSCSPWAMVSSASGITLGSLTSGSISEAVPQGRSDKRWRGSVILTTPLFSCFWAVPGQGGI